MANILQQLAVNDTDRNTLREYFIQSLQKKAIDKVFKKEDVTGLAEAGEILESVFDEIASVYDKGKKIINSPR